MSPDDRPTTVSGEGESGASTGRTVRCVAAGRPCKGKRLRAGASLGTRRGKSQGPFESEEAGVLAAVVGGLHRSGEVAVVVAEHEGRVGISGSAVVVEEGIAAERDAAVATMMGVPDEARRRAMLAFDGGLLGGRGEN